jgi:hypothetical protein
MKRFFLSGFEHFLIMEGCISAKMISTDLCVFREGDTGARREEADHEGGSFLYVNFGPECFAINVKKRKDFTDREFAPSQRRSVISKTNHSFFKWGPGMGIPPKRIDCL